MKNKEDSKGVGGKQESRDSTIDEDIIPCNYLIAYVFNWYAACVVIEG